MTILTSKLMDPISEDAAMAYSLLGQLLSDHPPMKTVVGRHVVETILTKLASEMKSVTMIHRPVLFLSELQYYRKETDFARFMVGAFLQIFRFLVRRIDVNTTSKRTAIKSLHKKKMKRRLASGKTSKTSNEKSSLSSSVEIDPNSRLFRVVLNGLTRAMPYACAEQLPDMNDDWKALDGLIKKVENSTVKIAILNVLHRLAIITQ